MEQPTEAIAVAAPAGRGSQRRKRNGAAEIALIAVAIFYAGVLLLGPLAAILWGAFSEGILEFFKQLFSRDALEAFELTLLLGVVATAVNTVFGVCIAWVLVR